jgi:hypothetical protein
MAHIRYDIVPNQGGWSIACNGIIGLPYQGREVAIRDATWVADLLGRAGEEVRVYLEGRPVDIDRETAPTQRRH